MARYLADTSAWAWSQRESAPIDLQEDFSVLVGAGDVATCGVVTWELLHSTNNLAEFRELRADLKALDQCPLLDADFAWALDIAEQLDAKHGGSHHRMIKLADTLIAAAALRAGLPVLHYDEDYDHIARVSGQPAQWIRPKGTL